MKDYIHLYNRRDSHYSLSQSRSRALVFLGAMGWTFFVGVLIGAWMGMAFGGVA